jgi:hypothetical protein
MASTLTVGVGRNVILTGGAQARNIFWQVGSSATLGTSSVFEGTIMAYASITMNASSTMDGRALAQTGAVTYNGTGGSLPTADGPHFYRHYQNRQLRDRHSQHRAVFSLNAAIQSEPLNLDDDFHQYARSPTFGRLLTLRRQQRVIVFTGRSTRLDFG